VIFLLNPHAPLDILDYWNLRAAGRSVYPVTLQAIGAETLRAKLLFLIEKNFRPVRDNPTMYHHTVFTPGRSCDRKSVNDCLAWLAVPSPPPGVLDQKLVVYEYPRLWDEWARQRSGADVWQLEVDSADHDLPEDQQRHTLPPLSPTFARRFAGHGTPRFANQIELRYYGSQELMAEVIPEGPPILTGAIGGIDFDNWRFGRAGLVYLADSTRLNISFSPPKAEDVFLAWLKVKGWKASLSSGGRLARQMLKHLGGIWGVGRLANRVLLKLLETMSHGKPLGLKAFRSQMHKVASAEKYLKDPNRILEDLIRARAFELGIRIQCPICAERSWYSLREADYDVKCATCLEIFSVPSHSPSDIEWAYRSTGPFSVPGRGRGVYCVLLVLRFFSRLLNASVTPLLSFEASKPPRTLEVDLALLLRENAWWRRDENAVFCECKTFNRFQRADVLRMKVLAAEFPGSVLVFATLNDQLSSSEKNLIRPLANRGRRQWKEDRPVNPVLVLTARELFADQAPDRVWRAAGGKYATLAQNAGWAPRVLDLCNLSQQLYLDMNSWFESLIQKTAARAARRRSARTTGPVPTHVPSDAIEPAP
jgi:hypothetical protein